MSRLPALILTVIVCWPWCATHAGQRVVVLTYNIHHGEGNDQRIDLERIARVIRDAAPDLVALQEVDRKTRRAGGVDQAQELARLTGMHLAFGQTIPYQGGQYGNAILSRRPLTETRVEMLPMPIAAEPRVALAVRLKAPGDGPEILFIATHLDATSKAENRIAQITRINRLFAADDAAIPTILAGDLNDTPGSKPIELLTPGWLDTSGKAPQPTWPADKPRNRIDYVLVRPADRWRVVETQVLDEKIASDHRPLKVVLELSAQPGAN